MIRPEPKAHERVYAKNRPLRRRYRPRARNETGGSCVAKPLPSDVTITARPADLAVCRVPLVGRL
jgi:hypothetical protein